MIYGANGYTGSLIAREARRRGLKPILGGRNREAISAMGKELGMETRIFACDTGSPEEIAKGLEGIELVLHCAGPFSATSASMLEGCLKTKTHYLDITGEISVFENIHGQSERIKKAGIVAIPGVGFDVVPTDCLAAILKEALPDATSLALAFKSSGGISPGTAKTMVEGLGEGGAVRKDGKITRVPTAYKTRTIVFEHAPRLAVTIPWGDVSTAYHSTGIPNVETYIATTPTAVRAMKALNSISAVLKVPVVQIGLKKIAQVSAKGPTEEQLNRLHCVIWGEACNAEKRVEMRLTVPEGYALTRDSSLAAVERVLRGDVKPGAWTPSKAFGSRYVMELGGTILPP